MELLQHRPSVVIVALDGDEVVVVRQSRPGAETALAELSEASSIAALALWRTSG